MIKSLILHDLDMAWSSLRITVNRHDAVDFLSPYYKNTYALVIIILDNVEISESLEKLNFISDD